MTPFPMHWTCCGRLQGATALSACSTCPSPDRGGFLKAAVQAAALQIQQAAFQGQQEQQAQLDQVAALLRELQERLLVQQQLPARQFRSLEGKLGALEGSVLSAGKGAEQAARAAEAAAIRSSSDAARQLQQLPGALQSSIRSELQQAEGNQAMLQALSQLNRRLGAIEGSVSGLDMTQREGLKRLAAGMQTALGDAEVSLQAALREETQRLAEPIMRLPQAVATALPLTDVAAALQGGSAPPALLGADAQEDLRSIVRAELQGMAARIVDAQTLGLQQLASKPVKVAPEQWNTLGRALQELHEELQAGLQSGPNAAATLSNVKYRLRGILKQTQAADRVDFSLVENLKALQQFLQSDQQLSALGGSAALLRAQEELGSVIQQFQGGLPASTSLQTALGDLLDSQHRLELAFQSASASQMQGSDTDTPATVAAASITQAAIQRLEGQVLERMDRIAETIAELPAGQPAPQLECREAKRIQGEGGNMGYAVSLLQDAQVYYEAAADLEPDSTSLQGNWGSALLAYGDVKKQLLQQLFEGPQPTAPEQVAAVNASRKRLREEALAALLEAACVHVEVLPEAGRKYQKIVQQDTSNIRALTRWATTICMRASLTANAQVNANLHHVDT
eukprot:jgi/Astpho2/3611/fgenesh1_pg.00058_%23_15_t